MKMIKIWCHIKAMIKKIVYKIVFGRKLQIGKGTTWRHDFHIAIEGKGKIEIGKNCFFNNGCSLNVYALGKVRYLALIVMYMIIITDSGMKVSRLKNRDIVWPRLLLANTVG